MVESAIRSISSVRTMAVAAVFLLAILLRMAAHGEAQHVPRPVRIERVSGIGSGCSSATARLTSQGRSLTISVKSFQASATGGLANRRNNCVVSVSLSYPTRWQVSLNSVKASGSARLGRGVGGVAQVGYHISGMTGTARASLNLNGPYNRRYTLAKKFRPSIFTACRMVRDININFEVRVNPRGARRPSGVVNMGGATTFGLTWKKC